MKSLAVACVFVAATAVADQTHDYNTDRYVVERRALDEMLRVPAGPFTMGATATDQSSSLEMCQKQLGPRMEKHCSVDLVTSEIPPERVYLSSFWIDRIEVTVGAYRRCVAQGICDPLPIVLADPRFVDDRFPITNVTYEEAERYCHWRGGGVRLPSEAEWERAARGTDGRLFPWGRRERPEAANHGKFFQVTEAPPPNAIPVFQADASDGYLLLAPVASFPSGASPVGALDMAGNAAEWTSDFYASEAPQHRSRVNPTGPSIGDARTVRGGSWRTPIFFVRTTSRLAAVPTDRSSEIGFRCARSAEGE